MQDSTTDETRLARILALLVIVYLVGVVFFYTIEKLSLVDALYFTAMVLTTVGFGDISPVTVEGKLFTAAYSFIGVGIFLGFASVLFHKVIYARRSTFRRSDNQMKKS